MNMVTSSCLCHLCPTDSPTPRAPGSWRGRTGLAGGTPLLNRPQPPILQARDPWDIPEGLCYSSLSSPGWINSVIIKA